jgi:hypothetical protein
MHVEANHGRCGAAVGAVRAIRRAGAMLPEPATVLGMLPDFRFVIDAVVAIALLGVAGLGLVTSVQLVREAHMGPLDDSRSLAFAGHAEWNQFYDPEAARRFAGLTGGTENPTAEAPPQAPKEAQAPEEAQALEEAQAPKEAETLAPAGAEERTASIPAHRIDSAIAEDKPPESPPTTETPAVVTMLAPPIEAPGAPTAEVAGATEAEPPSPERPASAPTTSPAANTPQETEMPAPPPQVAMQEPTEAPAPTPMLIPAQPQAADPPRYGSQVS